MDSGIQDDINKVEINEEVGIIFPTIWPFDDIGVDIDSSNLNTDADIYFAG